ncbi:DUF2577 domain-containing protein [Sporosarcina sp. FSL K6-2383]|uniref:DUF2577 domain-containing protein n=1 Tax=Sporosarcina sp. FSL K6-2383 TaxID=2921556 RepID=UPI00315B1BC7
MIELIKITAMKAFEASNPVNIFVGTVANANPIEIEIHQKLKLTREFLVITERVTRLEIDLKHNHGGVDALTKIVIREGLKKGDGVVLARVQGGQQFVVLDKVVD